MYVCMYVYMAARHVSVIFEKLGYDGSKGVEVFGILCEELSKRKVANPVDERYSLFSSYIHTYIDRYIDDKIY